MNGTGLCECGCGGTTTIAPVNVTRNGYVKGQPRRFITGHHARKLVVKGYPQVRLSKGVRADLHRELAARALGKPLPPGAVVHHADGSKSEHSALVICQDNAYHRHLHARMRIKAAGGNPNTDAICSRCHLVKPRTMFHRKTHSPFGVHVMCRQCRHECGHGGSRRQVRVGYAVGTRNPNSKLNDMAVRVIKFLWARGMGVVRLASAHRINPTTVRVIVDGEAWQHVTL